jgi:hypothetical protein
MQRKGVRVAVISTISTQPPMVADELRRQADEFIDLVTLQSKIGRDPSERAVRTQAGPGYPSGPRHNQQGFGGQTPGFMAGTPVPNPAGEAD